MSRVKRCGVMSEARLVLPMTDWGQLVAFNCDKGHEFVHKSTICMGLTAFVSRHDALMRPSAPSSNA